MKESSFSPFNNLLALSFSNCDRFDRFSPFNQGPLDHPKRSGKRKTHTFFQEDNLWTWWVSPYSGIQVIFWTNRFSPPICFRYKLVHIPSLLIMSMGARVLLQLPCLKNVLHPLLMAFSKVITPPFLLMGRWELSQNPMPSPEHNLCKLMKHCPMLFYPGNIVDRIWENVYDGNWL